VDFDPVHAKARGEKPAGMPDEIADLFPSEFVHSNQLNKPIPKGWEIKSLGEVMNITTKSIKPYEQPETVWEHYSIPAFDIGKSALYEQGDTIKSNKYVVPENSILFSKLNPETRRVWSICDVTEKSICSTEFIPLVPNNFSQYFLYECITSDTVYDEISGKATGSTGSRQRIKPDDIKNTKVLLPTRQLIVASTNIIDSQHKKIKANIYENLTLTELRDSLLPKLISGEIEV
jgi:type I restriction enzyme S subunit